MRRALILLLGMLLTACAGNTPSPTDPEVQKIAHQVSRDLLVEAIQLRLIAVRLGALRDPRLLPALKESARPVAEEILKGLKPRFEAVRIMRTDPDIGRTEFAAVYRVSDDASLDITGSAQYTEDGDEVYVEIQFPDDYSPLDPMVARISNAMILDEKRSSFACNAAQVIAEVEEQMRDYVKRKNDLSSVQADSVSLEVVNISDTGQRQAGSLVCEATLKVKAGELRALWNIDLADSSEEFSYVATMNDAGNIEVMID